MASGAARFTRRYTQAQKDALIRAVCLERVTVAEAVRMAERGDLGMPAFKMQREYAYELVSKGREAFEASNETALGQTGDDLLRLAEHDAVAHLRRVRAQLKRDGTDDPTRLVKATQALSGVRKARREANTGFKPTAQGTAQSQTEANTPSTEDKTLSTLLAHATKPVANGARTG